MVEPPDANPRRAAVLIALAGNEPDPMAAKVLLLKRPGHMRSHAGHVAFPGGGVEQQDVDNVATATREATEETGLPADAVSVVGLLPSLYIPPSNFSVVPVVAWLPEPVPVAVADPNEVEEVAWVSLADLMNPENRVSARHPSGFVGPAFRVNGWFVWGFTAGIIARFFDALSIAPPWDDTQVAAIPRRFLDGGSDDDDDQL